MTREDSERGIKFIFYLILKSSLDTFKTFVENNENNSKNIIIAMLKGESVWVDRNNVMTIKFKKYYSKILESNNFYNIFPQSYDFYSKKVTEFKKKVLERKMKNNVYEIIKVKNSKGRTLKKIKKKKLLKTKKNIANNKSKVKASNISSYNNYLSLTEEKRRKLLGINNINDDDISIQLEIIYRYVYISLYFKISIIELLFKIYSDNFTIDDNNVNGKKRKLIDNNDNNDKTTDDNDNDYYNTKYKYDYYRGNIIRRKYERENSRLKHMLEDELMNFYNTESNLVGEKYLSSKYYSEIEFIIKEFNEKLKESNYHCEIKEKTFLNLLVSTSYKKQVDLYKIIEFDDKYINQIPDIILNLYNEHLEYFNLERLMEYGKKKEQKSLSKREKRKKSKEEKKKQKLEKYKELLKKKKESNSSNNRTANNNKNNNNEK